MFYENYRPGDDGNRIPDAIAPHACIKSSADYELSLILKEIRYITDQVILYYYFLFKIKMKNTKTLKQNNLYIY